MAGGYHCGQHYPVGGRCHTNVNGISTSSLVTYFQVATASVVSEYDAEYDGDGIIRQNQTATISDENSEIN